MDHEKVRPGEIISSDLMNFILNKLQELDDAVNGLGQTNQTRITGISPNAGGFVGEFMQIQGANFLHPPGDNVIRIGGQLVTEFQSPNTSALLSCRIPASLNVNDPAGEEVIVRVENAEFGSAEATYRVFPEPAQAPVSIASVLTETNSDIINTGFTAIITGEGFANSAAENSIRLEAVIGGSDVSHTVTAKSVNTPTRIEFTVPDIPEIDPNNTQSMLLILEVGDRSDTFDIPGVFRVV